MKRLFFALFSMGMLAISCKKDKTDPVDTTPTKPYTNVNAGTQLVYRVVTDSGSATQTAVLDTVTVNGGDTTINSKTYKIFVHSNAGTHSYYNNTGNDYYQFQQVAALGTDIEQLYLKDNAANGDTWYQDVTIPVSGVGDVPVRVTYKIVEKGTSKVVAGITYNDVIGVQTDISSSLLPSGTIVSDIKSYYARNVGLILGLYNIDVSMAGIAIHTDNILVNADLR